MGAGQRRRDGGTASAGISGAGNGRRGAGSGPVGQVHEKCRRRIFQSALDTTLPLETACAQPPSQQKLNRFYFARLATNSIGPPRPPSRFIWISSPLTVPVK